MKTLLTIFAIMFVFPSTTQADPYSRKSDTRTKTTESVAGGRKVWGLDLESGVQLRRGNIDISSGNFRLASFGRIGRINTYISGNYNYFLIQKFRGVNAGNITGRFDFFGRKAWRLFAFTTHGFNEFLLLDYRTNNGLGVWVDHFAGNWRFSPSLAIVHEFENFKITGTERTGRLPFRMIVEGEITNTAKLGFDFFYDPALKDFNDFRIYFEPYLETQIYKDILGLRYRLTFERDNAPKPGVKKNDTSTAVSLTLHLGK